MTKYLIIFAVTILGAFAFPNPQLDTFYNGRIVGGTDAEPGQFPYIVSLQTRGSSHNCGGSIVTPSTVMTAAHCIRGSSPSSITVVCGLTKLSEGGKRYAVKELKAHPSSDIGLIILENPIEFSDTIQPIDWERDHNDENREAVVSGWGRTGASSPSPDHLQFVNLRALSLKECNEKGSSINEADICTYTKSGEGTCFGDSGGPLVSGGKLIGCVSRGRPCAIGYPDIFGRVSYIAQWLLDNIV